MNESLDGARLAFYMTSDDWVVERERGPQPWVLKRKYGPLLSGNGPGGKPGPWFDEVGRFATYEDAIDKAMADSQEGLIASKRQEVMDFYDLRLMVLAAPRSGTRWIAKALTEAGLHTQHENIGHEGTVNPARFAHVCPESLIHQVRHPLHAIPSIATIGPIVRKRLAEMHGLTIYDMSMLEGLAAFWFLHNRWIEQQRPILTYRIEDVDKVWPRICELGGLSFDTPMPDIPRDTGHSETNRKRFPHDIKYEDLGAYQGRVRNMARGYGYEQ